MVFCWSHYIVGVVGTERGSVSGLYMQGGCGPTVGASSDLVVISYISCDCVGRRSIYTDCDSPQFSGMQVLQ